MTTCEEQNESPYSNFATDPPDLLVELVDIIIWDMSGRHEPDKWLEVIKTRNDIDHPAVQAAIAVIMDY